MTDSPDKAEVRRGLARIRALRRLFLGILFGYFPILVLCMAHIRRSGHWHTLAVPLLLFVAGMVVQKILHGRRCPRCGELFFVQTVTRTSYTPDSAWSFPPQKACQNCGLRLYH